MGKDCKGQLEEEGVGRTGRPMSRACCCRTNFLVLGISALLEVGMVAAPPRLDTGSESRLMHIGGHPTQMSHQGEVPDLGKVDILHTEWMNSDLGMCLPE